MKIKKKNFEIPFPIEIFEKKEVDFTDKSCKNRILKRNMYYYLYGKKTNKLLIKRRRRFYDLALEVKKYLDKNKQNLKILSISLFGSSLYCINNDDYDFLVIVEGEEFDSIKVDLSLNNIHYSIGISIKGKDNLERGKIIRNSNFSRELQDKIIKRTSISLPIRHLPILGFDFKENKQISLDNCYAQAYDLLYNTYDLFYLKSKKKPLNNQRRSQKILSRLFEASKYLSFIKPSKELERRRKNILKCREKNISLSKSKEIFKDFVAFYNINIK